MFRSLLLALLLPLAVQVQAGGGERCNAGEALDNLVGLVHQRLNLAEDVAHYKWNRQLAIEDLPREQAIITSLGRRAAEQGLPAAWAEAFFRAQIEASKAEQRILFAQWREQGIVAFHDAPDLITVTRPKLDDLTPHLIATLAAVWPHLTDPACGTLVLEQVAALGVAPSWHAPDAMKLATAPLGALP
ncbi:MAG: gamma subclass chorismate mutase AroQ [Porticoccaceae bacterium]|jgi:chorismate mutase